MATSAHEAPITVSSDPSAPAPGDDLDKVSLDLIQPKPLKLYRIAHSQYPSPLFWGRKGEYRFDSIDAEWGVCYLAGDMDTAFLEVYGDPIVSGMPLVYSELDQRTVWRVTVPNSLQVLSLAGANLAKIKATTQSFVSSYSLSQKWGRALMAHPCGMDGVIYTGRKSGKDCLALFGDEDSPRAFQSKIQTKKLGKLTEWDGFYPFLDAAGARVSGLPDTPPTTQWSL